MDNIIHSISDVITNSSTELFITPKDSISTVIGELLLSLGLNPNNFLVEKIESNCSGLVRPEEIIITRKFDNEKIPFSDLIRRIFEIKEFNV